MAERQQNLARVETLARQEASRQAKAEAIARSEAEVARKAASDSKAKAEEALAGAVDQTYLATRNEVRALRLAHESGWRAASLERISRMARLGSRNLDLVELRSEAIATLAKQDLRGQVRFIPPNMRCWRVQFSPDGRTLAANDSNCGAVHLLDLTQNRQLDLIPAAFKGAPFAFHPGGALAVVSAPGRVTYQALAPGQRVFPEIHGQGAPINLAFSRSGERIAILWGEADPVSGLPKAPERITIHETRTGAVLRTITLPTGINVAYKTPMALSPDGGLVATTGPHYDVRVYSVEGDREPVILGTLDRDVGAIAFHPDGRSLAACGKQVAVVWDLDTRTERARVHSGDRGFWDIAFSPNGQYFATISDDAMCRLWDGRSGRELASAPTDTGLGSSLAITPRGDRIAVGASSVCILAIEGGRELRVETSQTNITRALVFDPTEPRLYHVGGDRHLYRWNLNESAAESIWTTRSFTVPSAMRMSPTGRDLIIGGSRPRGAPLGYDDVMQVLPRENLAGGRRLKGPRSDIRTIAVSPSGHRIAAYSQDGKLYVWDYDSGTLLLGKPVANSTRSLEFLDDARLLCASNDRIRVVSATDGGDLRELQLPSAVGCFVLTPDRAEALVGTIDGTIHRVSLPSLTVEQAVKAIDPASPLLLAISPDGSLLAATSKEDAGVALIDTKNFETLAFLPGPVAGRVNVLEFDPTGRYLACGEVHIRLWDLDLIREELGELGIGWDAPSSTSRPATELALEGTGPRADAPDQGDLQRYLPAIQAAQERVQAGVAAFKERRFEEAVAALRQADAAFRGYRTLWPGDPALARLHGISLGFLAGSLRELGKPAEAAAHARRSIRVYESIADPNPGDFYNTACGWAIVAALDAKVSPEERERCAARAVASLGRAIAGDRDAILEIIGGDHDLDILRGRADFNGLIADAHFPTNPFVATKVTIAATPVETGHDEASSLFEKANGFARRGDWKAALADFQAGLALDRNHTAPWMSAATLYLKLGDVEGYRRHARAMFDLFGATDDPADAERTAKIGLLTPPPDEEAARLLLLADLSVTRGAGSVFLPYFQLARGMAAYRTGKFRDAADWLEKASASVPKCRAAALAYLAMSRARLGESASARTSLEEARQILKDSAPTGDDLGSAWHDWLICRFAIQEAEDVLGQPAAKPAQDD